MIAAPGTAERRKQDKAMIESPDRWPRWPLLPVKKPVAFNDLTQEHLGIVTPDYPSIVIHGVGPFVQNWVHLVTGQLAGEGDIEGVKTTRYQDVDAMLDDGWTVD